MSAETIEQKAVRYLGEGRLTVRTRQGHVVEAVCSGGAEYALGHESDAGWWCDCPARVVPCAHLIALQLVTTKRRAGEE